jgi:hypothetical protein
MQARSFEEEKEAIIKEIDPLPHQKIFFPASLMARLTIYTAHDFHFADENTKYCWLPALPIRDLKKLTLKNGSRPIT